jgi:acetyl esterase/lipase
MPVDAHVRRLLRTLALAEASGAPPAGLAQRRESFAALMRLGGMAASVAHIDTLALPGPLALRVYTPLGGARAGLLFLHGGGFVCGGLDTHDSLCRALCAESDCRVMAVDYRLAPEHPFPAALEDAQDATLWVLDHAADLGLDSARIGIAGDSAGATLAAVTARSLARVRPGAVALQLLLCPILDFAAETESRLAFGRGFLLDSEAMAAELACYLPPGQDARDARISPLRADSLGGLPPAMIHTAEYDPLRDEGAAYADRLRLAGIAVRQTCHPGMIHMFYALGGLVPRARVALAQIGAEVRAALA